MKDVNQENQFYQNAILRMLKGKQKVSPQLSRNNRQDIVDKLLKIVKMQSKLLKNDNLRQKNEYLQFKCLNIKNKQIIQSIKIANESKQQVLKQENQRIKISIANYQIRINQLQLLRKEQQSKHNILWNDKLELKEQYEKLKLSYQNLVKQKNDTEIVYKKYINRQEMQNIKTQFQNKIGILELQTQKYAKQNMEFKNKFENLQIKYNTINVQYSQLQLKAQKQQSSFKQIESKFEKEISQISKEFERMLNQKVQIQFQNSQLRLNQQKYLSNKNQPMTKITNTISTQFNCAQEKQIQLTKENQLLNSQLNKLSYNLKIRDQQVLNLQTKYNEKQLKENLVIKEKMSQIQRLNQQIQSLKSYGIEMQKLKCQIKSHQLESQKLKQSYSIQINKINQDLNISQNNVREKNKIIQKMKFQITELNENIKKQKAKSEELFLQSQTHSENNEQKYLNNKDQQLQLGLRSNQLVKPNKQIKNELILTQQTYEQKDKQIHSKNIQLNNFFQELNQIKVFLEKKQKNFGYKDLFGNLNIFNDLQNIKSNKVAQIMLILIKQNNNCKKAIHQLISNEEKLSDLNNQMYFQQFSKIQQKEYSKVEQKIDNNKSQCLIF